MHLIPTIDDFIGAIAVGVLLIVLGFIGAKMYHEWWRGEPAWIGNVMSPTSRFDHAIGWLPLVGLLLIVSTLLWGCLGMLLQKF
jgi:hypothetical protein